MVKVRSIQIGITQNVNFDKINVDFSVMDANLFYAYKTIMGITSSTMVPERSSRLRIFKLACLPED